MKLRITAPLLLCFCATTPVKAVDFERDIRPLLQERCVECHGAQKQKGGLRLDAKAFAFKGSHDGPALVPANLEGSTLYQRISSDDSEHRMPPRGAPLAAAQVAAVKTWIESGAVWPENAADLQAATDKRLEHWAWQPIRSSSPGATLDGFIEASLMAKGLHLSPPADARTLIRRLTYDLHGLPPTPEEVQAFVNDSDPQAYEKLVDRLLASPRHGERYARHWLDIAHYADTHGFERDQRRDNAWRYRDYVIQALNTDKPYDQFLREQIAGDVLAPEDPQAVAATGFLAAGPWDFVGQVEAKSEVLRRAARTLDLDDMVTQVMTAACGVTVNCARCHDHKLDPISQHEYYSLVAVFAGLKRGDRELNPQHTKERENLEQRLTAISQETATLSKAPQANAATTQTARLATLRQQEAALRAELAQLKQRPTVYATVASHPPPPVHVLRRGDPETPAPDTVAPGALSLVRGLRAGLGNVDSPEGERRQALAAWITHPNNPLTRRVIVNRLWHWHFGQGLVNTPSDLGLGGGRPSHPALLDWLAEELMRGGWSLKHLHKLIVMSAAYRQSSSHLPGPASMDAQNRLLWRQNPRRLEAEALRDAVLAVSGKLNLQQTGGPGYADFDYTEGYAPVYRHITADSPALWRRSIYRFVVRSTPHRFLTTLDCPDPANLTPARLTTTTALQSLALFNNDFVLRQARHFASRLEKSHPGDTAALVQAAYALAFSRRATLEEEVQAAEFIRSQGLFAFCRCLFNANEFVYVD